MFTRTALAAVALTMTGLIASAEERNFCKEGPHKISGTISGKFSVLNSFYMIGSSSPCVVDFIYVSKPVEGCKEGAAFKASGQVEIEMGDDEDDWVVTNNVAGLECGP